MASSFSKRAAVGLAAVIFLSGCFFRQPAHPPQYVWEKAKQQIQRQAPTELQVGTAKVEITPPVGTPLAGYSKRKGKPSVGIRDPLYVRAMSLSDGTETMLILSVDLLIFPQPVADRLLDRICLETKLPRRAIVLATTHTHSGTGAIGHGFLFEEVFGRYDPQIVEGIAGRIAWAAQQALEGPQPVRWGSAKNLTLLTEWLENRAIPGAPVDPALDVLFWEGKGGIRAVVVHTAAHPTLMDSKDLRISADFPGEICRRVEESYPGSVCLFFNGTAGDARPRDSIGENEDQRLERFGGLIAEGVTGLLSQAELKTKADVAAWGATFVLPTPQVRIGPIPLHPQIGRMMRPTSIFLNLIAVDKILLVPLSAEMTSDVGLVLKQNLVALGFEPFEIGYANGYIGYSVSAERYDSGSYEAWMTWYGPGLSSFLIERFRQLASLDAQ